MPYKDDGSDVPSYVTGSSKRKRQWSHVWNSEYQRQKDKGKSDKDAEEIAFAAANGVAGPNAKLAQDDLAKRQFHSVQFNLSPYDAVDVLGIPVADQDFADKGREMIPHITVRFGFHPEVTREQVNAITKGTGDVDAVIGDLVAFPEGEHGTPLVLLVESEKLLKLNAALAALPHTDTHPKYRPHINVGYLRPNAARKYVSTSHPLKDKKIVLSDLIFGAADHTMSNLEKAADDSQRIADSIVRSLEKRFRKLPAEVRNHLEQAALSGAAQGMLQVDVGNAKLLASANQSAKDYATDRAAELVGMKYDTDGNLVENPDARWAISETTRDKIREIISNAFKKQTDMEKIRQSIKRALRAERAGGGIFSDARASMIARTEVMRSQTSANFDVWRKSGVVRKIQWSGVGDDKECTDCSDNDGVSVELGHPFPSGAIMPGDDHPLCRCLLVASEFTS